MQTNTDQLKEAAPALLAACKTILDVINMSNPDHPHFRDSGADVVQALCEQESAIRAAVKQAEGPVTQYYALDADGVPPSLIGPITERNAFLATLDQMIADQIGTSDEDRIYALELSPEGELSVWDEIPEERGV